MFRKILILGGLLIFLAACNSTMKKTTDAVPAAPANAAISDTMLVKLKNGLTVLAKRDDRFPLVNVRLYVHAGSAYETPEIAGISHLLEHMVFKGTKKREPGQTAMDIESVGGSLNAATSFDYTVYYVEVPDKEWKLGMDVVTDMAFDAAIDPKELKSERKVVLAELERGEDTPGSRLFKSLQGMLWKGTSYEWPIIGYRETVEGFSSKDIHAYIDKFYQPQSMLLTVVGNIDPADIVAEADRLIGSRTNDREVIPPTTMDMPTTPIGPEFSVVKGKWNKVYLGAAFPIPGLKSAELAGLEMTAHLLGGDDTSRLYRKFKYEKRLVDDISISPLSLERSGFLYVNATLDSENVVEFWTELMKEFAHFDPKVFTDREIERARLNLEDSLFLTKETLSGLASKLGYFQFFEDGEEAEQNYLFALKHVDRKEMAEVFGRYLRPDRLVTAILVPESNGVSPEKLKEVTTAEWNGKAKTTEARAEQANGKEIIELPGGSKLVLLPDATLPYTAMSIYWTGGDGDVSENKQGLASLAAKALTRGTKKMSANEIEDFLSDHAANIGATSGRNLFALESKFPSRFSGKVLPLLKDVILNPAWRDEEIERAKQDQIAAIQRQEDRPLGLMFRHLFPYLFANAPYSYLSEGSIEGVQALKRQDAVAYWANQTREPFVLAVVGDYDRALVTQFAKDVAKSITTSAQKYVFKDVVWNTEREKTMTLPDRNQAHLLLTFPVPGKDDLDASAELNVLKAAFSGQSGLLFRDMRDKQGLGYTVTAILWQTRNDGLMALYIGTQPEKVEQALNGFHTVIADLQANPLPESEISRARNILTGDYYQEHQSLLSRSREASSLMAQGFDMDHKRKVIDRAQTVTAEEIRDLVRKYLNQDKAYLMKVVP
ncbi:M16 family metallopeptidase [Salidesulfovibrio onnuriiensis]|uniref:M16 family metallopeptidase n=1 Tax=Salidesulfovibrio onnuriiensis TaxID=2583823 RepID=UPI0011C78287|nr:pitrilysin family protein [Salidesulfovibrio onnuriiensis]